MIFKKKKIKVHGGCGAVVGMIKSTPLTKADKLKVRKAQKKVDLQMKKFIIKRSG